MQTAALALAACATVLSLVAMLVLARTNARLTAERTAQDRAALDERIALLEQVRHLSNLAAARTAAEAATLERAQRPAPAPTEAAPVLETETTPEWV